MLFLFCQDRYKSTQGNLKSTSVVQLLQAGAWSDMLSALFESQSSIPFHLSNKKRETRSECLIQIKMKWSDGPPSAVLVKYLSSAFPKPVLESPVIGGPGPILSESDDPF